MAKVMSTPPQEDSCAAGVQILGPRAVLAGPAVETFGDGAFGFHLRNSVKEVVSGGTIDSQHNLIARSLGRPSGVSTHELN